MFSANAISSLYDAALAVAYPQVCAVCRGSVESRLDGVSCARCWQETRLFTEHDTICWQCGALALAGLPGGRREDVRCHRCGDAAFGAARACGLYQGALRASIVELKRTPHVPKRLLQCMSQTFPHPPLDRATLIVPVPLHRERENERGFNQAAVLARALSRRIRLPVAEHCLVRVEQTVRHRAGMDAQARRQSVDGAFAVVHPRTIEGEDILLIDDVFTTGATISACAEALRSAGAREVLALTLARPLA